MQKTDPDPHANRGNADDGRRLADGARTCDGGAQNLHADASVGDGIGQPATLVARNAATDVRRSGSARLRARARVRAIESLLGDDSPRVWDEVRREIVRSGKSALPLLERAARGEDPLARTRARALLQDRERRAASRGVLTEFARRRFDLEKALFRLARFHTAGMDPRPYEKTLDEMAAEVARRARLRSDPLNKALVLVEYLGLELGFGGSAGDFHHPDNIHLHRALERRAGMPLTLCAIYLFVARRAGLRAACLPLPGHVMLRLYGGDSSASESVIVDPYHKGQTRTERDCRKYLAQNGLAFQPAWFRDASEILLLKRQVANLKRSAELSGRKSEARELTLVLSAFEPRTGEYAAAL